MLISYRPVRADQYDEFLQLMRRHAAAYLEGAMALMGLSWEEFGRLFRTVGQVYGIYRGERLAGFYWIEEREPILHLHGLVLREEFQGEGLGTGVLEMLEATYRGRMEAIELGVHRSNRQAKALYERLGYTLVQSLDDLGFFVLQKAL